MHFKRSIVTKTSHPHPWTLKISQRGGGGDTNRKGWKKNQNFEMFPDEDLLRGSRLTKRSIILSQQLQTNFFKEINFDFWTYLLTTFVVLFDNQKNSNQNEFYTKQSTSVPNVYLFKFYHFSWEEMSCFYRFTLQPFFVRSSYRCLLSSTLLWTFYIIGLKFS